MSRLKDALPAAAQGDAQGPPAVITADRTVSKLVPAVNLELQLVSKWLLARKRPRDWKQQEYSTAVTAALQATSSVLTVYVQHKIVCPYDQPMRLAQAPAVYAHVGRPELLDQTAAAQQEVCQLLQAALKQQQQQQGQQAVQEAAQQLKHLQDLACGLLQFWAVVDGMWAEAFRIADPACALAAQKHARCASMQWCWHRP
jgi:hypothetical protein